jgi:hypothetical protein
LSRRSVVVPFIGAVDALSVSLTDRYKKKRKEITC